VDSLPYIRTEPDGGRAVFIFDDPHGTASQVELQYERGAVCAATRLFASQKFLRREIDRILKSEARKHDEYNPR